MLFGAWKAHVAQRRDFERPSGSLQDLGVCVHMCVHRCVRLGAIWPGGLWFVRGTSGSSRMAGRSGFRPESGDLRGMSGQGDSHGGLASFLRLCTRPCRRAQNLLTMTQGVDKMMYTLVQVRADDLGWGFVDVRCVQDPCRCMSFSSTSRIGVLWVICDLLLAG